MRSGPIILKRHCTTTDQQKPNHDEFTQRREEAKRAEERSRKEAEEEQLIKDKILEASLPFVGDLGWTKEAISAGAESIGYPAVTGGVVQNGGIDLVHYHYRTANGRLEDLMIEQVDELEQKNEKLRVGKFLRENVENRLRMNIPYMPRWAEAMGLMSLPQNVPASMNLGLELVDDLWHYAGDKSTDYNWYTKRLSLAAILKTTELAMMQDKSADFEQTWKFLDRRFADHQDFTKCIGHAGDIKEVAIGAVMTARNILGLPR